ncbi:MAG: peptidoglycan-binding protein [Acidimicrobiia bacterium]|nr:peptidoglycan-binding protein [Acidimicrobiia bacterium]
MRRGVAAIATIAVAVAAAGAGWLAGRNITSPDQAALESEPPPVSLITVEVELAELSADVIIRADVGYDEPTTLGLSGALGNRESALVVTSAPERGAELTEGSVAIEVAGQPVFVLVGPVPVYRDLRPQDRGPDVEQLEAALARLGYFEGTPDQLWDEATGAAVGSWYEQAGYRANGPSDTEKAALEAARDRLDTARDTLADAQRSLAEAGKGATELAVQQARTAVAQAELVLDQARRALSQATTDAQAQLDVRSAEDRLAAAQQALADLLAEPDTKDAARLVESASNELSDATEDLAELEATTGVWLPAGELIFLKRLPARGVLLTPDREAPAGVGLPAGELIFLKRLPVRVDLLTAERGSTVSGSFMTVTGSELAVRGSVSERDVDRVSEGMKIRIEDRSLEAPVTGTIRLLDRRAGTRGKAPDRHYVEIVSQAIPDQLVGRNVKIVIPVGGTEGPVLVVPNAALSATASGLTRVEVEQPDGTTRFVSVEPGLSTGGRAEVTPVDGELREGDLVVVGVASGE